MSGHNYPCHGTGLKQAAQSIVLVQVQSLRDGFHNSIIHKDLTLQLCEFGTDAVKGHIDQVSPCVSVYL